jgi:uncharacterized membrane protein (UPF0182 family)
MRIRRLPLLLVIGVAAMGIPAFAEFYTDWLWFAHVGYERVFLKSLSARAIVTALAGLVVFALLGGNLMLALRALRPRTFLVSTPQGPQPVTMDAGSVKGLAMAGAALVSLLVAFGAGTQWETWLYFQHATPFGRVDPVVGRDVGFYVFTLPLLEGVHGLLLTLTLLTAAATLAVYVLGGEVGLDTMRGLFVSRRATRHLAALAALLFLVLGFGAWLQVPQLLISASGNMTGAGYADVHARMPAQRVLVGAALVSAALALWQAFTAGRLRSIVAAAGLYVLVSVGGVAYAAIIQRFVVAPNEQVRETQFITYNIEATRAAYALDGVAERPITGDASLTRADLDRNTATLANVPLWNDRPLLDTFGQIQEIRTYYDFYAVDNDRYMIDGQYRQIMLSARELNSASLPSRTWINERLTFTHGYGLTLGPVNEVTPEGLPVLFIKDLPLVSTVDLKVTQPAIYFGELQNEHVFVKTKTEEFDYPRGDANVSASYAGRGGVPLSNLFRRLMFAIRFRSTDTFFSPNLTEESRVMMYRRIAQRVERIMPSLSYDPDPYLTITDGRLVWMQDAYTTSRRYPYSTASGRGGLNYIRNSIKVTVDAYDGTTTYHVVDPSDPIAQTIGRIFPDLLKPLETMPETLRTRLRYPQQIFAIQAAVFATFHMTNPAVFYNREDQWEIPTLGGAGQDSEPMAPYYTIMKLPGEQGAEYIQMLPFTPRGKDNLAAWMVARSDGGHYGKLAVFQFPKQTVVFGPKQIAARISQDQVISPQITLWNQQGSEVIQGTLLVIPIEESLIYIRPLYLRAAGGQIPELKRVIVAYQNEIAMAETLTAALDRILPRGSAPPVTGVGIAPAPPAPGTAPPGPAATLSLAEEAQAHYTRAIQAQREGNWALYGEEIKKLGEVLERMRKGR